MKPFSKLPKLLPVLSISVATAALATALALGGAQAQDQPLKKPQASSTSDTQGAASAQRTDGASGDQSGSLAQASGAKDEAGATGASGSGQASGKATGKASTASDGGSDQTKSGKVRQSTADGCPADQADCQNGATAKGGSGEADTKQRPKAAQGEQKDLKARQDTADQGDQTDKKRPKAASTSNATDHGASTADQSNGTSGSDQKRMQSQQDPGKDKAKDSAAASSSSSGTANSSDTSSSTTARSGGGSGGGDIEVTGSVNIEKDKAARIHDTLIRGGDRASADIDVDINIGTRLPDRVRPRPLPRDIVEIVPEFRGYDYVVVREEIVILEPRTRKVVQIIDQRGSGKVRRASTSRTTVELTDAQRDMLRKTIRREKTRSVDLSIDMGQSLPEDVELAPLPDEVVTEIPELKSYDYVVTEDEIVLVAPTSREVVEIIR